MPETRETDPALPESYWQYVREHPDAGWCAWVTDLVGMKNEEAHAAAALALYGQPFGFSHQDVEDVRWAARTLVHYGLTQLADKLAALLPPAAP